MTFPNIRTTLLLASALTLTACGGGSGTSANPDTAQAAACSPADPTTSDECGTVLIGFTDADGDFLNYTVDVVQLTLETANGRTVEVLPQQTRINFTDYVDLTELVTAATVPPATYVSGTISLDYSDSEVVVESGDQSKAAIVTDGDGTPLQRVDLKIVLSNRDQLTIVRRRAALLQLDFDLEASHDVNIEPTPATAAAEHFILAEVHPVDEKDLRVRGPLVAINAAQMNYVVAIRPFHGRDGDFGRFAVNIGDDTEFEVDGVSVRFALDYPEADDLLEELIAAHSAPKNLAVVSSDHRVQVAAKRRGCQPFDSQPWLDDLMRGNVRLAVASKDGAGQGGEPNSDKPDTVDDVQQWMRDFGF